MICSSCGSAVDSSKCRGCGATYKVYAAGDAVKMLSPVKRGSKAGLVYSNGEVQHWRRGKR